MTVTTPYLTVAANHSILSHESVEDQSHIGLNSGGVQDAANEQCLVSAIESMASVRSLGG